MAVSGFVIRAAGLGVAAALALPMQPATAGQRETAAVQIHHRARVESLRPEIGDRRSDRGEDRGLRIENGGPATAGKLRMAVGVGNTVHGEFSFVPVTPLKAEVGGPATAGKLRSEVGRPKQGPATPPGERKSITFFRLDPKLGDVSVQPVIGGVNGAQLSVGF